MSNEKKNISSGAKKAESLTRKDGAQSEEKETVKSAKKSSPEKPAAKATAKPAAKKAATKKSAKAKKPAKMSEKKAAALKAREEKKLHAAEVKAERKQKKLEKRLEAKQKRLDKKTEAREKREERKAAKAERRDLLKNETKAQRAKRIERERQAKAKERTAKRQAAVEARVAKREAKAAEKQAKREHRLKLKAERRLAKQDRQRTPGFGGWLAAVISLGVTSLALATIVTFGWMNMTDMQADMAGVHTQSLYELNAIVDNLDSDLSKARASSSAGDRARVLSDIAIESEMAQTLLERLPMDTTMTGKMTAFINKMGDSAQSMLYTVAEGGELTSSQIASLNYMYETNLKLKEALNKLIASANDKNLSAALRDKGNELFDGFSDIQNNVIQTPKGIQDGPFSDSLEDTNPSLIYGMKEISAPEAEKLAREAFADYKVTEARCTGEAVAKGISCYNVTLTTADGEMLAQLTKKGGKIVMFDSYKECADKNFNVDRCKAIAEDFLTSIGYEGLKAVWTSENGTTCNLNFAPEQDGAVLYPDLIKVKVCEERGLVTGVEALSYVLNHSDRKIAKATISKAEAQSAINGDIDIESARLALIPFEGEEVLCYEFAGRMDGREYFIYVDAQTGVEVQVLTVIGTKQGRAIL
ncbi:MAG: PepSY1/2 domain-containing protein [Candidatus Coproplasma sp.]